MTMKTNEVVSVRELTDLPEKLSFVKRKNSHILQRIEEENALQEDYALHKMIQFEVNEVIEYGQKIDPHKEKAPSEPELFV